MTMFIDQKPLNSAPFSVVLSIIQILYRSKQYLKFFRHAYPWSNGFPDRLAVAPHSYSSSLCKFLTRELHSRWKEIRKIHKDVSFFSAGWDKSDIQLGFPRFS